MVIFKTNAAKSLNGEECDHYFINNIKYHYIAIKKPNALLGKLLAKRDTYRSCLNFLDNFQTDEFK